MDRSRILYIVVGVLIAVVAVMGYQIYQDRQEQGGVQIEIGPGQISIEEN